ncbi:MAG: hypothetical protein ACXV8N_15785, partial [Ilumatobacteraceae bacterium]
AIAAFLAGEVLDGLRGPDALGDVAGGVPEAVAAQPGLRRPAGTLVSSLLDELENLSDDEIDISLARRSGS